VGSIPTRPVRDVSVICRDKAHGTALIEAAPGTRDYGPFRPHGSSAPSNQSGKIEMIPEVRLMRHWKEP
jgi:hypothetical protein